jgi:hypothetical protein
MDYVETWRNWRFNQVLRVLEAPRLLLVQERGELDRIRADWRRQGSSEWDRAQRLRAYRDLIALGKRVRADLFRTATKAQPWLSLLVSSQCRQRLAEARRRLADSLNTTLDETALRACLELNEALDAANQEARENLGGMGLVAGTAAAGAAILVVGGMVAGYLPFLAAAAAAVALIGRKGRKGQDGRKPN